MATVLHSKLKVLGKPEYTNVVIAAHAICASYITPSPVFFENFLGFQLQDSITLLFYQYVIDRLSPICLQMYEIFLIYANYMNKRLCYKEKYHLPSIYYYYSQQNKVK